jgi:GNAT superfamily N-acetyltransferase
MKLILKNTQQVMIRLLQSSDKEQLTAYLQGLSHESKSRFSPHLFDYATIDHICAMGGKEDIIRYVAETEDNVLVAYMLIKPGLKESDANRIRGYGLHVDAHTDCSFAPSVADALQGSGLGTQMFYYIKDELKKAGKKRLVLWGGVQGSNYKAIDYYRKTGFRDVGEFDRNGKNLDMVLEIN